VQNLSYYEFDLHENEPVGAAEHIFKNIILHKDLF